VTAQTPRIRRSGEVRNLARHAGSSLPDYGHAPDVPRTAVRYVASTVVRTGGGIDACRELLDALGLDARDGKRRR
jgi:hypothetical protein